MPVSIGISGGAREVAEIFVGTSAGAKAVLEGFVGAADGSAKAFYNSTPPPPPVPELTATVSDGYWQMYGSGPYYYQWRGDLYVSVSGGVAPHFFNWGGDAAFGTNESSSGMFILTTGDIYPYDQTYSCQVTDSADPPNTILVSGTVRY